MKRLYKATIKYETMFLWDNEDGSDLHNVALNSAHEDMESGTINITSSAHDVVVKEVTRKDQIADGWDLLCIPYNNRESVTIEKFLGLNEPDIADEGE